MIRNYIYRRNHRIVPNDAVVKRNNITSKPRDVVDSRLNTITILQQNKRKGTQNDKASSIVDMSCVSKVQSLENER